MKTISDWSEATAKDRLIIKWQAVAIVVMAGVNLWLWATL